MRNDIAVVAASVLLAGAVQASWGQDASAAPAIVSHVKVLSDKVEDVSSVEAWKKSFIKDGMTEEQRALAIWTSICKFRQQHNPPNEYLDDAHVHDPIKDFNVYGYNQCCCSSAAVELFARYVGMETRGWGISHHSVPEVKINGKWGMLDGSLVNYFRNADGTIAGVKEISDSVTEWFKGHPDLLDPATKRPFEDHEPYYKIMRNGQWRKDGPKVFLGSSGYDDNGWLPAHTHAWGDSLIEFGSGDKNFLTEYGSALGYQVNIQLRPGEKLIRNWSNKGLNINDDIPKSSRYILTVNPQDPKEDLRYSPKLGDLTEGRVGNGVLEYNPPLETLQATALTYENLTVADKVLKATDPKKPGVLVIRMPSSYVYLNGTVAFDPLVADGNIRVSISDNNGLDWKPLALDTTIDGYAITTGNLKSSIYRRYDYQLKFEITGNEGIRRLKVTNDIQYSQRPLPALDKGDTKISFSVGPQEGTITVQGALRDSDPAKAKNLVFSQFHPKLENVQMDRLVVNKGTGVVTVPVQTPGEMSRIRMGVFYRAVGTEDRYEVDVSFDGGKTFEPFAKLDGPNIGNTKYVSFDKVPAGTKAALVRITGKASADERLRIQSLRIDADYKEARGGLMPVKVTYAWEEEGQAKTDVRVIKAASEEYTIHCNSKPRMKAITLEVAP